MCVVPLFRASPVQISFKLPNPTSDIDADIRGLVKPRVTLATIKRWRTLRWQKVCPTDSAGGQSRICSTPIQSAAPKLVRLTLYKMTVCLHSTSTLSLHFLHHSLPLPSTTTMSSYELAFQLHGHASDVRTLCAPSPDIPLLISGSRDGSALLWGPGRGKEWDVKLRVEAPEKKYVSCVGMTRWQGEGESLSQ